jgi:hypothetical protein
MRLEIKSKFQQMNIKFAFQNTDGVKGSTVVWQQSECDQQLTAADQRMQPSEIDFNCSTHQLNKDVGRLTPKSMTDRWWQKHFQGH